MLKSSLCDYSNGCVLVKGSITVAEATTKQCIAVFSQEFFAYTLCNYQNTLKKGSNPFS